jgi:hypothetical protein
VMVAAVEVAAVVVVCLRDHSVLSGKRDLEHPNSADLKGPCRVP